MRIKRGCLVGVISKGSIEFFVVVEIPYAAVNTYSMAAKFPKLPWANV